MREIRIIEVTGCPDCPHCSIWHQSHPGVYVTKCEAVARLEVIGTTGFPGWCPLPSILSDEEDEEKAARWRVPSFLKRQAE